MNLLTIIFGGLDHKYLERFDCPALKQKQWGKVIVDGLHNQRDVATQITAQLITGKTWKENGVHDRRKRTRAYQNKRVQWIEEKILRRTRLLRAKRMAFYEACGFTKTTERNFLKADLKCPCLFDTIPNSKAVYIPAYNPEPSWALSRNILDPRIYPELGVEGALDLLEKNFAWRSKRLFEAMDHNPYRLLMGQFQFIDSSQHLYLVYHDTQREDLLEQAYLRMNEFAEEILARAKGKYDRVLFVSENGAARKEEWRPTHHNRPCYSTSWESNLDSPNLRDFFGLIQEWTSPAGAISEAAAPLTTTTQQMNHFV